MTARRASLALVATVLTSALAAAMGPDIAANGSFETGSFIPPGSYITVGIGNGAITSWSVVSGNVDYKGTYWLAADGGRSIDLSGNRPGAIRQALTTEPGVTYEVRFALAGNPDGQGVKWAEISAAQTLEAFAFDSTGHTRLNMGWGEEAFTFVATSTSTNLTFRSLVNSAFGPAIDNVRVNSVEDGPGEHLTGVNIDIRPHSETNPVNPRSRGVIPVAVLGTDDFDVNTVNEASLAFGPSAAAPEHDAAQEDVNGDGYADLVLHFRTQDAGIADGDLAACLTGNAGGPTFSVCDNVSVVPM